MRAEQRRLLLLSLGAHSLRCAVLVCCVCSGLCWCSLFPAQSSARRSRRSAQPRSLPTLSFPSPLSTMSDLTPVLILVAAGFAALFLLLKRNESHPPHAQPPQMHPAMQMPPWMMQPPPQMQPPQQMQSAPNADLRAMQETLKMLVEAQTRNAALAQQTQQQQPTQAHRTYGAANQSAAASSSSTSLNSRMRAPSDDDDSGAPTPVQDQSGRQSLNRTPSTSATPAVPFELLQDMKALQDSIKNLERKNRELNRQLTLTEVSNVVDVERKYRLPIPVLNPDSGASAVQSIQQLNLSASEIETIRAIFNMFDVHQTGQISTKELSALHKQLGEPLTDDEANAAVSELDQEGTGRSVRRADGTQTRLRAQLGWNRGIARSSVAVALLAPSCPPSRFFFHVFALSVRRCAPPPSSRIFQREFQQVFDLVVPPAYGRQEGFSVHSTIQTHACKAHHQRIQCGQGYHAGFGG